MSDLDSLEIQEVVCDGYHIKFNSPIEFILREEPSECGEITWLIGTVEGFGAQAEALGENIEDLIWNISDLIIGTLQFPPLPPEHDHYDEEYEMFFNYLKNSVESSSWIPPHSMQVTGLNSDGGVSLEFA